MNNLFGYAADLVRADAARILDKPRCSQCHVVLRRIEGDGVCSDCAERPVVNHADPPDDVGDEQVEAARDA